MISYNLSVNGKKGYHAGVECIDTAIYAAYCEARDTGLSVTVLQVEGDEDALEFTPLCVITTLPVKP